jgi:hypothetical protein
MVSTIRSVKSSESNAKERKIDSTEAHSRDPLVTDAFYGTDLVSRTLVVSYLKDCVSHPLKPQYPVTCLVKAFTSQT